MVKTLLLSLFLTTIVLTGIAQVPAAFNYQAVVRNSSGEIVANKIVSFKISILQNSVNGSASYVETHSVSTNGFGLVSLKIGQGTSYSGSFNPANWGSADHFMKVEVDENGGTAYNHLGTTQLLAVPYAFHAQTVENDKVNDADADASNELQSINLSGTQLTLSNGGGTVTLPSSGGGDNWGTQTVNTDETLAGQGTTASPLKVSGDLSDDQTLSISGYDLSISEGNTVRLPKPVNDIWTNTTLLGTGTLENPLIVNREDVDKQMLSLSGNDLTISNGNTVTLPTGGETSLWNKDNGNIYFDTGDVGIGAAGPEYSLDIQHAKPGIRVKAIPSIRDAGNAYLILDKLSRSKQASIIYRTYGDTRFHTGLLGTDNYSISTSALDFNGLQVKSTGDVEISDELHTTKTGTANMVPIAYGSVEADGSILSGSGNFTVTISSHSDKFLLSIDNEQVSYETNTIIVSGIGGRAVASAGFYNDDNQVFVTTYDLCGGDFALMSFSFVLYKP